MGLFDIFKTKSKTISTPPLAMQDKNVARLGRIAADRRAQNYDRLAAIETLANIHTAEAAAALLRRFTFYVEPSMSDEEEKNIAHRGIVECGEDALEPIRSFCGRAESLTLPLKILREILSAEAFYEEVLDMLEEHTVDYVRNVEPKVQLLAALEAHKTEDTLKAVETFLEDVSEPVRFQAVATLLSLDESSLAPQLATFAIEEESVRIRNKVADGFAARGWAVPSEHRDRFASALSASGFQIDSQGKVNARA